MRDFLMMQFPFARFIRAEFFIIKSDYELFLSRGALCRGEFSRCA